jgi:malic enzyme
MASASQWANLYKNKSIALLTPNPGSVQWEDWSTKMAFDLLRDYRDKVPSFNDDVRARASL